MGLPADEPLLSVIVPTHDRPTLLARALASIADQTLDGIEVVVVDDGSAEPQDWVSDLPLRITFVRHDEARGLAAARNAGLRAARGRYVGYLDDDDRWYPQHAATLVQALEASSARAAYSLAYEATEREVDGELVTVQRRIAHDNPVFDLRIFLTNLTPVLAVVHERSLLAEVGEFDETMAVLEDWDFWIRVRMATEFVHVPSVTCEFTVREGGNMTTERAAQFPLARGHVFDKYRHVVDRIPQLAAMRDDLVRRGYAIAGRARRAA